MNEMNIEQIHDSCLSIATEFDRICRKYHIPYYMLGGTMLGAVRHKGFIPWDDDMDFGVPYEYYDKLIKHMKDELPFPYRCCTHLDHPCVFFPFMKIEDMTTILDDDSLPVKKDNKIGVNVDVFPLFRCSVDDIYFKRARRLIEIEGAIFTNSRNSTFIKKLLKGILRIIMPFNARWIAQKSLDIINKAQEAPFLFNAFGRWSIKECIPIEWYGEGKDYLFENVILKGFEDSHSYLTQLYGNYMELPPLSKRDSHSSNAYKKN